MAQSRVLHVAEIATKRVLRRRMQIAHVVDRHQRQPELLRLRGHRYLVLCLQPCRDMRAALRDAFRSEEHTSELQSLMRISYAVFCLKKKNKKKNKRRSRRRKYNTRN